MFTIPLESSWNVRDKIGAGILIVWSLWPWTIARWIHWTRISQRVWWLLWKSVNRKRKDSGFKPQGSEDSTTHFMVEKMENNATKISSTAKSHVFFWESWWFFPGKKTTAFTTKWCIFKRIPKIWSLRRLGHTEFPQVVDPLGWK